ncbi:rhodanese-like domain-containing protein [Tersicoccus sp. Bi-70]|uniref:rhodanese-like domain-containing protein n=1 Tax=Tersicoccus sp. Bi-70 TaxID=1897634 RepID=UPI00097880B7|nr:rhodanese-like domain-containing protein [Tersicoccus sp. Bi-70]OMH34302.1 sulfurtransferase [Tersicoccus sp. Bi-70]
MTTPTITTVEPTTVRGWIDRHDDLLILDVRSAAEFETLHISGSYNVPLPLLAEHTAELASRLGERVVLVCQSGVRAEQARVKLAGAGIDTAYVLTGGAPGYAAAGGDVVRGAGTWAMERQVRMAAGSLVLASILGGRFVSPKLRAVAGVIGGGLAFSAASNTCAMGQALAKMPWNRTAEEPTAASAIGQLPRPTA